VSPTMAHPGVWRRWRNCASKQARTQVQATYRHTYSKYLRTVHKTTHKTTPRQSFVI